MPLRGPDPEHFLVSIEEAVRVLAELIETSPVMSVRSVADHLGGGAEHHPLAQRLGQPDRDGLGALVERRS